MAMMESPKPHKALPLEPQEKKEEREGLRFATTFKDVIGLDKVKETLNENIGLAIKRKDLFERYNKERSMALILYGSPGTGKTHLVRAMSGEYKMNVLTRSLADLITPYPGETELNIQELFKEGRESTPCIIFLDEIDQIGISRDKAQAEGSGQIMQNAVNQMLIEMDGIVKRGEDLFIIGATNRPHNIDAALKRGGRFETSIYLPLPNVKERKELLVYYLKANPCKKCGKPIARMNYGRIARITMGFSSADIKKLCIQAKTEAMARQERNGNRDIHITTGIMLTILKDREKGKSSSLEWFNTFWKEQLPKFNKQDEKQYSELVKDAERMHNDAFKYALLKFISMCLV